MELVNKVFITLSENEIYTTYNDINDSYLEIVKCLDNKS